jgi:7,8-dihydro-6-hydroxymethylpterin dimethyltransferase
MIQVAERKFLKETMSRCMTCFEPVPAEVVQIGDKIYMDRFCPKHKNRSMMISSDARFYYLAKAGDDSCSGGSCCSADGSSKGTLGRNEFLKGNPFEFLNSCVALIEIVDSCNMPCPTCYAGAEIAKPENLRYSPLEDVKARVQDVINRKNHPLDVLQLSGGEPTLHPQFFELLDWALANDDVKAVLVNTNGLKLAHRGEFTEEMAKRAAHDKLAIYLQFDGLQEAGQVSLRGADYRKHKMATIEICKEMGLVIHLAMTVTHDNLDKVSEVIDFGLKYNHIRGVSLQPVFGSGRGSVDRIADPISVADVVKSIIANSSLLKAEDFTPLPCGNPNCHMVAGIIRTLGMYKSVRHYVDFSHVPEILRNKVNFRIEDLDKCGCDGNWFAQKLQEKLLKSAAGFFILIKPFMDARMWDDDRIAACCTHVIKKDGKLDSFCHYYSGFPAESGMKFIHVQGSH